VVSCGGVIGTFGRVEKAIKVLNKRGVFIDKLLIVIVNYRTANLVVDCLNSLALERERGADFTVVVVDNASEDGSVEVISKSIEVNKLSSFVSLVDLNYNGGFSAGNNTAIRDALAQNEPPQYIMLLNPDTVVLEGALLELTCFMDANPDVGIAGSSLETLDGTLDCAAHRFHSPVSELLRGAQFGLLSRLFEKYIVSPPFMPVAHECDWVSGASFFIRSDVFDSTGLFDDGYFLYFEEVDFCWRAKENDWAVWSVPDARIIHLEGQATGITQIHKRRSNYWFESRRRFFINAYGVHGLFLADLLWAFGRFSYFIRIIVQRKTDNEPKMIAVDLLWGDFKAMIKAGLKVVRGE
jgi:GT2 family glycosyltransferase